MELLLLFTFCLIVSKTNLTLDAKLEPYLKQIDEMEANVTQLSNVISVLDKHTKQLEVQLKPYL